MDTLLLSLQILGAVGGILVYSAGCSFVICPWPFSPPAWVRFVLGVILAYIPMLGAAALYYNGPIPR